MNIKAIARMVQSILYSHRFFPYYTYVILGGIDETDGEILLFLKPIFCRFRVEFIARDGTDPSRTRRRVPSLRIRGRLLV